MLHSVSCACPNSLIILINMELSAYKPLSFCGGRGRGRDGGRYPYIGGCLLSHTNPFSVSVSWGAAVRSFMLLNTALCIHLESILSWIDLDNRVFFEQFLLANLAIKVVHWRLTNFWPFVNSNIPCWILANFMSWKGRPWTPNIFLDLVSFTTKCKRNAWSAPGMQPDLAWSDPYWYNKILRI